MSCSRCQLDSRMNRIGLLPFSCEPVKGASGAQIFKMSTKQHAVNARTPLSLWPSRCCPARSFATAVNESLSVSSCSISRNSVDRASSLFRSSPVGIGFPARHVSGWLKDKPPNCGSSWTTAERRGPIVRASELGMLGTELLFIEVGYGDFESLSRLRG